MVVFAILIPLALWCQVQGQILQGVQFRDGRQERVIWKTPDFPSYEFDMDVPKEISFCVRFFLEFANQKNIKYAGFGIFQIWTHERVSKDAASIEFNGNGLKPSFWVMDADDVEDFRKQKSDPGRENMLRKWNSVCFSVDFGKVNQTCQMSWNGKISETKVSSYENDWGWNYGIEKPGFNFTIGKYWNGPYFIGKMVEFNAWNRTLTEEEHLKFTNCETYSEAKGNLMNSQDKWKHKNKYIVDYEVPWEEVQCTEKNSYTGVPIAERQKGFFGAEKTCNKLELNGMLPEILTHQDYQDHYWWVKSNSAFEDEFDNTGNGRCWHGGPPPIPYPTPPYFENTGNGRCWHGRGLCYYDHHLPFLRTL